jgi:hypothetical protein
MSRLLYKDLIVVDLISAYSPEIPSDISFFFQGSSSIAEYLKVEAALVENDTFKIHLVQNSMKILVKTNNIKGRADTLIDMSVFDNFRNSPKISVLIGIMDYSKKDFKKIEDSVLVLFELAEILIGTREDCTITIASLNDFSKMMINTLKINKDCVLRTFMNNKDMRIDLYDRINCKYCNEIPCEAYVTTCCCTLYCENCKKLVKNCFDCGLNNINLELEEFFTKFLKNVRYKCKCGESFTCETIKIHSFSCELTVFRCKVENCKFEGSQAELVAHVIQRHFEDIKPTAHGQKSYQEIKKECFKCMNYLDGEICNTCGIPGSFEEILRELALVD